jgi:hypothetical protein
LTHAPPIARQGNISVGFLLNLQEAFCRTDPAPDRTGMGAGGPCAAGSAMLAINL